MLSSGIPLGLGTDGSASSDNQDVFAAMRLAALIHRAQLHNPSAVSSREVFRMATRDGYRILGFHGGEIKEGNPADIAIVNLDHPSLFPPNDLVNQLVLSSHPGVVRSLIIEGKLVYDSGKFFTINADEVRAEIARIQMSRAA